MRGGITRLDECCRSLVRRHHEVILDSSFPEQVPEAVDGLPCKSERVPEYANRGHVVNGYHRLGTPDDTDFREEWSEIERLRRDDASNLKTQRLLDHLFLICRAERFGGDYGEEPAIPVIMREIERRVVETRQ